MKFKLLLVSGFTVAMLASQTVNAQATEEYNPLDTRVGASGPIITGGTQAGIVPGGMIFYSNGPVSNSAGTGAGGADESILYNLTHGMTTLGLGHQTPSDRRIADDFKLNNAMNLRQVIFYAYQTGSPTTSTFTGVTLQIWNGKPDEPGSSVVWGDTTTNVLDSTDWSGIYRIAESNPGDSLRPIMSNLVNVETVLPAGTYWLDWSATGSAAFSGPWAPPIALVGGITDTGNGQQFFGGWGPVTDSGSGDPQGFPFELLGNVIGPVPGLNKFGKLALILFVFAVFVVRRQRQHIA